MCGICGAMGFESALPVVQRMNLAMVHRGPDSCGFLTSNRLVLGMRRLKIIDLNTGDQPIYNEDRTVAIVFNGEIYNFEELYQQLRSLGHQFSTRTDTEAVVHAYEQWGKDCLGRLRGMFAFAICDRRPFNGEQLVVDSERLFLARDRLGIKPLYYWRKGNQLLFASEVRALLASGEIPKFLSVDGLYTYLALGSVQEPLTMISGVNSLPPASWLQIDVGEERFEITQGIYWQPPPAENRHFSVEEIRAGLADAVSSHLVSDVPLGAFLSGGLDSGSIVALGSQALGLPMRTFTLAFDNWPADERDLANYTATRWKSEHQVRVINQQELLAEVPQAIASMDQPTVDGVNTWYVCREAKRSGLTVALSGVGGDELFAGYPSFYQVPRLKGLPRLGRLAKLPGLEASSSWLPGNADNRRKLVAFLANEMPLEHPYFAVRGLFTQRQIKQLLQPSVYDYLQTDCEPLSRWRKMVAVQVQTASHYDAVGEVTWLELTQYMRSTLLRDTDMMSMAHSLEVRVPFVDHFVIEKVLPLQGKRKLNGNGPKPLLVGALDGMLPPQITAGSKRTFTFPFEDWLRQGLSQRVGQRLSHASDGLGTWLDPSAVLGIWHDFEHHRTNWARPWTIYVLDAWIRTNL